MYEIIGSKRVSKQKTFQTKNTVYNATLCVRSVPLDI